MGKSIYVTTSLALVSMLVLALGVTIPTGQIPAASANNGGGPTKVSPSQWTDEYVQSVLPQKLSNTDLDAVKGIALADQRIQKIIANRAYDFITTDYIGDLNYSPVNWTPEVHYNVANQTQLTVVVDLIKRAVVNFETVDVNPILDRNNDPVYDLHMAKTGKDPNGFAIDRITGTASSPKELDVRSTAVTFNNAGVSTLGNVLLLNAQRSGATAGNACDSAHTADRYWAQIGFYWKTSGKITYDDTSTGCSNVFPSLTYTAGNVYKFSITGRTTGWELTGINTGTGVAFTYTSAPISTDTFQTSDIRTSEFFENKQASGISWASQFASNPAVNTAHWSPDRVVFNNWPNNVRTDQSCSGTVHTYPYNSAAEVISGELKSAGTATWSMTRMQAYNAC